MNSFATYIAGTLHGRLTTSATGNFTSGGALTGINEKLLMTGSARCGFTGFLAYYCLYYAGIPSFTIHPNYFRSGAISLAGSAGPCGGAMSTRHTLTGRGRTVGWQPAAVVFGLGSDNNGYVDNARVLLVGRATWGSRPR